MKKMKKWLSLLLIWMLLVGLTAPAAGLEAQLQPILRLTDASAARGALVTVQVQLEQNKAGVCGGSLNVEFAPDCLELVDAVGAELSNALISINKQYRPGTVRATIAGTASLPEHGPLMTLTFRVKQGAALGDCPLTLSETVLYDEQVQKQAHTLEHGTVTVQYAMLRVEHAESMPLQSVQVPITLDGALHPAGGTFTVRYDPSHLQAKSVVPGPLAQGKFLNGNVSVPGEIKISWAGDRAAASGGILCTLVFAVHPTAAGTLPLQLQQVHLYNELGRPMDTLTEDGSIQMQAPTEDSPKLWVVGGQVDQAGSASVAIVLEGRGQVSGGEFLLTYDSAVCSLTSAEDNAAELGAICVVNSPISAQNPTPEGTIRFSWASAAPSAEAQTLLFLQFQTTAVGGGLDLSQVRLLDADGQSIVSTDLRSGKIRPEGIDLQLPIIDKVTIESGETQTQALFRLDVASAKLRERSAGQTLQAVAAFYHGGRMQTAAVPMHELQLNPGGVLSVTIQASAEGTADEIKVFLISDDGITVPLTEVSVIPVP